jgi:hypothetical protein
MTHHHRPEWAGDESPGEHGRHLAARALAAAISAWSEREHYAGWMIGIEDAAWAEAEAGSEVGLVFRTLASWAGGWVEWGEPGGTPCLLWGDTEGEGVRFVAWGAPE